MTATGHKRTPCHRLARLALLALAIEAALPSVAALRTNVVERSYDRFGRLVGLSVDGERCAEIAYDGATGRIASMRVAGADEPFRWEYEPGTDLKKSLRYPNGAKVAWEYEPHRDLVTLVSNDVYSSFCYEYDAAGRRVSKNDERYEYNERGELTLATNVVTGAEFAYRYDDIGNRLWSRELGTNCAYAANELNQYTNIVRGGVSEHSAFDLDGNQTNVVTSTGEWAVEYNGENRPVRWTRASDGMTVLMAYDRMGRRVRKNGETFVYDGYLNVSKTVWDPTEPEATRPLVWRGKDGNAYFYTHDANKNVSDVVGTMSGETAAHYHYSAFGRTFASAVPLARRNPFRFSSEYADDETGLVYYNYRHYAPSHGRWLSRDPIENDNMDENALYVRNNPINSFDYIGLIAPCPEGARVIDDNGVLKYRTNRDNGGSKSPNGCGAEGGIAFPNSLIDRAIVDFKECCDNHDVCYGTCGSFKAGCDIGLSLCMRGRCRRVMFIPFLYSLCTAQADVYGIAVLSMGADAYESAQDGGCEWEECCRLNRRP